MFEVWLGSCSYREITTDRKASRPTTKRYSETERDRINRMTVLRVFTWKDGEERGSRSTDNDSAEFVYKCRAGPARCKCNCGRGSLTQMSFLRHFLLFSDAILRVFLPTQHHYHFSAWICSSDLTWFHVNQATRYTCSSLNYMCIA